MTTEPKDDKRVLRRFKRAITAICEVDGVYFQARTYDINERGITLFTGPKVPQAGTYKVHCTLPTDVSATFEVEERQRREMSRGDFHFLRLGLQITNESLDHVVFFRELAELQLTEGLGEKLPDDETKRKRTNQRLSFQLPVLTKIEGKLYKCQTLDMGSWGLSVLAPLDFPRQKTYQLRCIDPDGMEVPVTALVRNWATLPEGQRVGFMVIEGSRGFRSFVEKYAQW